MLNRSKFPTNLRKTLFRAVTPIIEAGYVTSCTISEQLKVGYILNQKGLAYTQYIHITVFLQKNA